MNTSSPRDAGTPDPTPWWRMPIWWLVIGGPAIVVVAALTSVWIAVRSPDPVLDTRAEAARLHAPDTPAEHARNHANTPLPDGAQAGQDGSRGTQSADH